MQYASFNTLEDVVEKEQLRIEHVRVVLAREKELSDSVARLKQELAEERAAFESEARARAHAHERAKRWAGGRARSLRFRLCRLFDTVVRPKV